MPVAELAIGDEHPERIPRASRAVPSSHEAWRLSQCARRSGTSTCITCCSCIHLLEMWVLECRVHMITDLRIVMLSRDLVTRVPELKAGGLSAPRADGNGNQS